MDEDDYRLSMRISPRAKRDVDNEDLRTLVIHRFTDTAKAVARIGVRTGEVSVFCEPCDEWCRLGTDQFPARWTCPWCGRTFAMEFAVMEELSL